MKNKLMRFSYSCIFLCITGQLFAQGHNHGNESSLAQTVGSPQNAHHRHPKDPPHGGELINIGKYDLEVILNVMEANEKFSVYLLKPNLKPIDATAVSGKAVFRYKTGKEVTCEFKNDNPEKLYCNVEDIINEFVVVITVKYKGKEYSTVCEYAGLTGHLKSKQSQ